MKKGNFCKLKSKKQLKMKLTKELKIILQNKFFFTNIGIIIVNTSILNSHINLPSLALSSH